MTLRKLAFATAAASLAISPVAAQAAPASRASALILEQDELAGGYILPVLAVIAIVVGIILLTDNDDDDTVSP